jgi:hypothetical protein
MKRAALFFFVVALALVSLSCARQSTYTVTATYDDKVLVARDRETMEYLIDCSITRSCPPVPVMELLYERKVFFVEAGAEVKMSGGVFSLSDAKKVQIVSGEHNGQYCWVYDRMLYADRSSMPYQLAFAQIYRNGVE